MKFPRLKELRLEKGLSQEELAELLHTKQTVYSRYERGNLTITVRQLLFLSELYDVSIDYILGKSDVKK